MMGDVTVACRFCRDAHAPTAARLSLNVERQVLAVNSLGCLTWTMFRKPCP